MLAGVLVAGALGTLALPVRAEPRLADAPRTPATLAPGPDVRWRARGMVFLDLPLGLRARYEARAFHRLGPRPDRADAFVDPADGASRLAARLLESRVALTRAVAEHVELELAWSTRSPLSMVDLLRIEDQRVAAMIRFVP